MNIAQKRELRPKEIKHTQPQTIFLLMHFERKTRAEQKTKETKNLTYYSA